MKIREHRITSGMTQKQLADASGVHPRVIQKLESGEYKPENLRAATLLSIAKSLGVDPYKLI